MAKEVKQWITVNGKHIPIFEGQSKEDIVKAYIKHNHPSKSGEYKSTKSTSGPEVTVKPGTKAKVVKELVKIANKKNYQIAKNKEQADTASGKGSYSDHIKEVTKMGNYENHGTKTLHDEGAVLNKKFKKLAEQIDIMEEDMREADGDDVKAAYKEKIKKARVQLETWRDQLTAITTEYHKRSDWKQYGFISD